jgi:hypothetical protein
VRKAIRGLQGWRAGGWKSAHTRGLCLAPWNRTLIDSRKPLVCREVAQTRMPSKWLRIIRATSFIGSTLECITRPRASLSVRLGYPRWATYQTVFTMDRFSGRCAYGLPEQQGHRPNGESVCREHEASCSIGQILDGRSNCKSLEITIAPQLFQAIAYQMPVVRVSSRAALSGNGATISSIWLHGCTSQADWRPFSLASETAAQELP